MSARDGKTGTYTFDGQSGASFTRYDGLLTGSIYNTLPAPSVVMELFPIFDVLFGRKNTLHGRRCLIRLIHWRRPEVCLRFFLCLTN